MSPRNPRAFLAVSVGAYCGPLSPLFARDGSVSFTPANKLLIIFRRDRYLPEYLICQKNAHLLTKVKSLWIINDRLLSEIKQRLLLLFTLRDNAALTLARFICHTNHVINQFTACLF
ncbi:hypothetical protein U9F88_004923 [Pluralibacter gergoviae]|nr:hypothetical protein [Pluralibacter gergoviae]